MQIQHAFGSEDAYPGLHRKAAALFYLVNKNHAFENGNKRMAVAVLYVFLGLNDVRLTLKPEAMYRLAKWVASSKSGNIGTIIDGIELIISTNTEPWTE